LLKEQWWHIKEKDNWLLVLNGGNICETGRGCFGREKDRLRKKKLTAIELDDIINKLRRMTWR
jgi:hypothetical protein